ncbi:GNAT family N-acetyltransferase [Ktedonosporobacter rubrisoli]|uniref:GNAT family N-acetyltransferase n=1 Tax=Ktedonosporobacter rubrisoli TaxID=2509675 RepID=A0A4P6JXU6_KTERU|nr:GNAT family N-acetyltransferase [Ktedonosporobacter rubrisoli]QBD80597.1 GNAT family N-acetyltransferase [Ktedonosporobacter rubrisoli]
MNLTIQTATLDDLKIADTITMEAFVSPSRYEALLQGLQLQPDGWFLARLDGEPIGFGGAINYGPFAYVGQVGVVPSAQRRGIGQAIMEHTIAWLEGQCCPSILLDASASGVGLYRRLGFVEDDRVLRLSREPAAYKAPTPVENVSLLQMADLADLAAFDAPYFGAERSAVLASFLERFPRQALLTRNAAGQISGFLILQTSPVAQSLGPWVAESVAAAECLLQRALELADPALQVQVILAHANRDGQELLGRYGFSAYNELHHMHLHSAARRQRAHFYGQASMAFG